MPEKKVRRSVNGLDSDDNYNFPVLQVAIITGASNGIGLATVNAFLSSGEWNVFGVDLSAAPTSVTGANFHFLQINITQEDAPAKIVSACQASFGSRIDALLNVAGVMDKNAGVDNLVDEDWDRIIAVNLTAPVRLMREVVNVMKEQRSGCIVNVASKAGMSGAAAGVAYTASKHGLVWLDWKLELRSLTSIDQGRSNEKHCVVLQGGRYSLQCYLSRL